jgi:hypothetical protein
MAVKVKGLDEALKYIDKKTDDTINAVKDVLAEAAISIELEATRNAPKSYEIGNSTINLSFIGQKIDKKASNTGLNWNVGLDVPSNGDQWEAWMEFGTGLSAKEILSNPQYSQEVKNIARTFYRNGEGRIIGKPYLMPAFYKNTDNLVTDMVDEINKALK